MIRVVVDDLALLPADAVIRPTTTRLDATTPAVRRLERLGGAEFLDRIRLQKELAVGAAVVTAGGGDLSAEFVIHTVISSDAEPVSREGVARAWRSALQRAREWEFARLTAPLIGIGAGNLSVEDAAEILVTVLQHHRVASPFPTEVSFVVETTEDRDVLEAIVKRAGARAS